ncbi:MAG: IS21 family transposase [Phocaeicola sp.]
MSKIKQILRYDQQGVSHRKIAKIVGVNRETVGNYVRKSHADPMSLDQLLILDDIELEFRLKAGSPAYPEEARFKEFQQWLPRIIDEMGRSKKTHVTLKLLWEEYSGQVNHPYSLTQFRYHFTQNSKASKRKTTTLLKDLYEPGLLVYVDYAGDKMQYIDKDTGEVVKVEVFVASFPYSDYGFALAVPSQRADDLAYAMVQLFKSVGGVPHIIVPDNLKSGVIKSDRYAPRLNDLLLDLANHYGSLVEPARVRHPQDKALVENSVKLTYQRAYAPLRNRQFYSLEELNQALSECILAHNQKRMQQYDHTREESFIANEKAALKPLPSTDYEVKRVHELKVSDSCFVYLSSYKAYYSVPCEWVGSTLKVVITRSIVKIYMKGECVATHLRDDSRRWIYDEKHFPKNTQNWRGRNRQWFVERGHNILWALGEYIDGVFIHCGTIEQAMYKRCDAILHLGRQTHPTILLEAIDAAIGLGKYNYQILSNLIDRIKAGTAVNTPTEKLSPPVAHNGLRGAQAYQ